jgi:hypothetical protein
VTAITIPIDTSHIEARLDGIDTSLRSYVVAVTALQDSLVTVADAVNTLNHSVAVLTSMVSESVFVTAEMRSAIVATQEEMLASVESMTTVGQSVVAGFNANTDLLRQHLEAEGVDQEVVDRVTALSNQLTASFAEAITRNTIAENEPTPEPPAPEPV